MCEVPHQSPVAAKPRLESQNSFLIYFWCQQMSNANDVYIIQHGNIRLAPYQLIPLNE